MEIEKNRKLRESLVDLERTVKCREIEGKLDLERTISIPLESKQDVEIVLYKKGYITGIQAFQNTLYEYFPELTGNRDHTAITNKKNRLVKRLINFEYEIYDVEYRTTQMLQGVKPHPELSFCFGVNKGLFCSRKEVYNYFPEVSFRSQKNVSPLECNQSYSI